MKLSRYLKGNLSIAYLPFLDWSGFGVSKYWGGRLFYFQVSKIQITLDCRKDIIKDMASGEIE